jgi:hypothetical protein
MEATSPSTTSVARRCHPLSKAQKKPIRKPAEDSDDESTSNGRPLSRSAAAGIVSTAASGVVPASELDGGEAELQLDGEERGLDCTKKSFSRDLSVSTRDLCIILVSYGVLYVNCTATAYNE